MGWILLVVAILLEVVGTTNMKLSEGFSKLVPSVLVLLFYALSIVALTFAVHRLDVSVAYAVWSGMGTALVAMIGIWFFQESLTTTKLIALGLIIVGVAMLHFNRRIERASQDTSPWLERSELRQETPSPGLRTEYSRPDAFARSTHPGHP
jgi:small multidrug resistance pump